MAQRHPPEARGVYPVSGSVGRTTQVTIAGVSLRGASGLLFDRAGVTAAILPPGPARLPAPTPDSDGNPDVVADITIAPNTPPGLCRFRVVSPSGVSSARLWMIGRNLSQIEEQEPNDDRTQAQTIVLPAAVNGHIGATGDQDTYGVILQAGKTFVAEAQAARVGSPLDTLLILRDAAGQEVASNDDYYGADSLLTYTPRMAGRYYVTIASSDGQAGPNHAYRLEMGMLPLLTSVYPAASQSGQASALTARGLHLTNAPDSPPTRVVLSAASLPGRGRVYVTADTGGVSNSLPILLSALPVINEQEPNDDAGRATLLPVPGIANGRFWHPGTGVQDSKGPDTDKRGKGSENSKTPDVDYYKFQGKAGQRVTFDVQCQVLATPADPILALYGPDSKQIAENDDTNGRDSHLDIILSVSGEYRLRVAETRGQSGPDYVYCLLAQTIAPGFALSADTRARSVGQGGIAPLEVNVTRDRWDGPVTLNVRDLPPGVMAAACVVPAGVNRGLLLLSARADAPLAAFALHIVGTAQVGGATVQQPLENAVEWVWNGGARQNVPAPVGLLNFAVSEPYEIIPPTDAQTVALARGQSVPLKVKFTRRNSYAKPVTLHVLGLPDGVTAADVIVAGDKSEATLELKATPAARLGVAPISIDCIVSASPAVQLDRATPALILTVTDPPKAK